MQKVCVLNNVAGAFPTSKKNIRGVGEGIKDSGTCKVAALKGIRGHHNQRLLLRHQITRKLLAQAFAESERGRERNRYRVGGMGRHRVALNCWSHVRY